MTDTPPPKRRFWQIHLSTAVILSVATGALVLSQASRYSLHYGSMSGSWGLEVYGWPIGVLGRDVHFAADPNGLHTPVVARKVEDVGPWMIGYVGLAVNFLLLVLVAQVSEYIIRRRSKP